ncbi:DUF7470 family protein [Natrialbaceae archaeon AArc-T1-2]|uniref:DUF7470 family protein n=1 Tax=Natrialbaceae archaeon AArc-T1-2 TaxID=3053904 RepID=UPI00255B115B|nr:hypothetical protein [Natrialbaceae archaeon AArc-T1-2]WIV65648.1 hypothetical protein QQ977_08000 [Natrialbaceae archaeon AArc-T1-2]
MLDNLGPVGIAGIVVMLAGIALVAHASLQIAAGIALVLAGLGIVVKALISGMLRSFGMMA